jgi:hypothetical protein
VRTERTASTPNEEKSMEWFEVEKEGFGRAPESRGEAAAIYERIQNAPDEQTRRIDVMVERIVGSKQDERTRRVDAMVERIVGSRHALLVVSDGPPDGFEIVKSAFKWLPRKENRSQAIERAAEVTA